MATAKIYAGNFDIVNGICVVNNGKTTSSYDNPDRTQHITPTPTGSMLVSGISILDNIDARYRYHGGEGGSGNWEH